MTGLRFCAWPENKEKKLKQRQGNKTWLRMKLYSQPPHQDHLIIVEQEATYSPLSMPTGLT